MTHKHFTMKDSMQQNWMIGEKHPPEVRRKAAIAVAASVSKDELPMFLDMLGLTDV